MMNWDIILGRFWLGAHRAIIDYSSDSPSFWKFPRRDSLASSTMRDSCADSNSGSLFILGTQAMRVEKKGCKCFICICIARFQLSSQVRTG